MGKLEILIHYDKIFPLLTVFTFIFLFYFVLDQKEHTLSQNQILREPINKSNAINYPSLSDRSLKIETVATGFAFPTGITFLGNNEILLLEKNTRNVFRIVNGNVTNVVIRLNTSIEDERGLLGIAISGNGKSKQDYPFVFLYFTSCSHVKTTVGNSSDCGNHIYRYELDAENYILVNPNLKF